MDLILLPVDILPLQAQQLTPAHAHAKLQVDNQLHLGSPGKIQKLLNLYFIVDHGLLFLALGQLNTGTGTAVNQASLNRLVHRSTEDVVSMFNGTCG